MPQKPLGKGKSKRSDLKGGKRIISKSRVTKVGASLLSLLLPHEHATISLPLAAK